MLGGDRDRRAQTKLEGLVGTARPGAALRLVGEEHDRGLAAAQPIGEMLVERGYPGARIDDEEHDVGVGDSTVGLPAHPRRQAVVMQLLETSGVDDVKLEIGKARVPFAAVAGHPRRIVDEREPLPDQPVEEGRFSDIGPADDRGGEAHRLSAISYRSSAKSFFLADGGELTADRYRIAMRSAASVKTKSVSFAMIGVRKVPSGSFTRPSGAPV